MMFNKQVFTLVIVIIAISACVQKDEKKYKEDAFVEILDNEALKIIDADAKMEILGEGYIWSEGPVWIEDGQFLLFSDIPNNKIHKIDEGGASEYLTPAGYTGKEPRGGELGSNALLLDNEGNLVLMQHGDRRVAKMNSGLDNPMPDFETIVGSYEG
ncbi:MAG: SMP-30/gluconolactonase/LRE family protein, partial [Allomuricauda sp.]